MNREELVVYAEKKRFVDYLSEAYEMDKTVKGIEYKFENGMEIVTISYYGGYKQMINVNLTSHSYIAKCISDVITTGTCTGYLGDSHEQSINNYGHDR